MKKKEAVIGVFIVLMVMAIIVPLPTSLVDFLLMVIIGLALIILLNALYAKEALEMSMFPTILLVITLFRISLSVSTTRLILGEGDAGEVIRVFGDVVAGGNLILGIILFLVVVLVNFLVIVKGSERVAEVTARFTLDAMPGKQMAIDADLNTGLITEEEAKDRRKKVQDESNFYGAMDGAVKFVKGDAIFSIILVFINLIGGVAMGATGLATGTAMPIGEALELFALLTIGDGLVSQIPALLISIATGLIVTKATAEDEVSSSLVKQLLSQPLVLTIAGASLIGLGIFGNMPRLIFIPAGLVLIFLSSRMRKQETITSIETEITTDDVEAEEMRRPDDMLPLTDVDMIRLCFGYGLIPLVAADQGGDLLERVVMIRRNIALELGAIIPQIRLQDNIKLSPNQYTIFIKGVEVAGGEIMFDHYMAMNSGYVEEEIDGIETVEPFAGLPAMWISESQRERAEALGYTVVDPPAIIATHLTEVVRQHLHELISRQDVQKLINHVKETHTVLVDELIPKYMSVGEVQKVLSKLLKESVSIRDLVTILETLADYAPITRDTDMLTEYVRAALRRAISKKFFGQGVNTVITLDPALEQTLTGNIQKTEIGSFVNIDPGLSQKVFDSLKKEVSKLTSLGVMPIILTSPFVRMYFKQLVDEIAPDLVVLSYGEIDQTAEVQSVGMVSVS
ncbi:MAG: flagellar biosynthesis protein FlhA [Defluviitaleaceae bacterium]|nr:flagellar biosynthesis protein FlhA [Defluviitaleaceae bacterium]MCL2263721.1 flagellar biosynthesis protein FlhA [Defluviitaleaceae bacterium]